MEIRQEPAMDNISTEERRHQRHPSPSKHSKASAVPVDTNSVTQRYLIALYCSFCYYCVSCSIVLRFLVLAVQFLLIFRDPISCFFVSPVFAGSRRNLWLLWYVIPSLLLEVINRLDWIRYMLFGVNYYSKSRTRAHLSCPKRSID